MRHKRVRQAIVQTLKENPDGLTASQIIDKLGTKKSKRIVNAKHVAVLVRGLKGVKKTMSCKMKKRDALHDYTVNVYFYDEEEGAEI
jgi:predicted Zn-ribbon and HTH transcriptional regulator